MSKLLIDDYPIQVLPKLAKEIGLNEAIVLQQIHYWLNKRTHLKDGKYWTYGSMVTWQRDQFFFWSVNTVKRTFASLEKQNLLIVGNYNRAGFDKTKWYAINYETLEQVSQRLTQNESTIDPMWVVGETQNETDNTLDLPETSSDTKTPSSIKLMESDFEKLWALYPRKEGKKAALKKYREVIKKGTATNKQIQDGIVAYKRHLKTEGIEQRFIKQGGTYFNGECWNDEYETSATADKPEIKQASTLANDDDYFEYMRLLEAQNQS